MTGHFGMFFVFLVIAIIGLLGFHLGGFFGVSCVADGLLSTPITMLAINAFGCLSHDSQFLGIVHDVSAMNLRTIKKVAWAARNYNIFS